MEVVACILLKEMKDMQLSDTHPKKQILESPKINTTLRKAEGGVVEGEYWLRRRPWSSDYLSKNGICYDDQGCQLVSRQ
jgi:hypothetical protein